MPYTEYGYVPPEAYAPTTQGEIDSRTYGALPQGYDYGAPYNYGSNMPSWYQPDAWIPTATPSPQVEFAEMANRLMPYMSPLDYRPWMTYLRTQEPSVFTEYTPERLAAWQPPRMTEQAYTPYTTRPRVEAARGELMGGLDPDSPAREWLNSIFNLAEQAAPTSGAPEARPSRMQQQEYWRSIGDMATGTGLLGSPQSYGVPTEQAQLWQPFLEQFLAPTRERTPTYMPQNAPSWLMRSSLYGPRTSMQREGVWANPQWM
jgi:hypothetical protein